MIRPLFVIGPSRSGTTAVTDYLNRHDEILICRERYKSVPEKIDPAVFTFEKILDYEPGRGKGYETDVPREHHAELLTSKDPTKLKWIGDKQPSGAQRFRAISANNPGAHFLITYRPIEEVVESFEDRAKNLDDPWIGGKNGLKMGVNSWNQAMRSAREYLQSYDEPNGLFISYHDFFHNNESYVPLLSEFLEIDFSDSIVETRADMSREFENRRREKTPITEEKAEYIRKNKDRDTEEWILERLARQWSEPSLYKCTVGVDRSRQRLAAALMNQRALEKAEAKNARRSRRRSGELRSDLATERKRVAAAEEKGRKLETIMKEVRASKNWKLLNRVAHVRAAVRRSMSR